LSGKKFVGRGQRIRRSKKNEHGYPIPKTLLGTKGKCCRAVAEGRKQAGPSKVSKLPAAPSRPIVWDGVPTRRRGEDDKKISTIAREIMSRPELTDVEVRKAPGKNAAMIRIVHKVERGGVQKKKKEVAKKEEHRNMGDKNKVLARPASGESLLQRGNDGAEGSGGLMPGQLGSQGEVGAYRRIREGWESAAGFAIQLARRRIVLNPGYRSRHQVGSRGDYTSDSGAPPKCLQTNHWGRVLDRANRIQDDIAQV